MACKLQEMQEPLKGLSEGVEVKYEKGVKNENSA